MARAEFELAFPGAKQVFVAGTFNDWKPDELKMRRRTKGQDVFFRVLDLPPGTHEYKFVVDGEWQLDAHAPSAPNEFGANSVRTVDAEG